MCRSLEHSRSTCLPQSNLEIPLVYIIIDFGLIIMYKNSHFAYMCPNSAVLGLFRLFGFVNARYQAIEILVSLQGRTNRSEHDFDDLLACQGVILLRNYILLFPRCSKT